MQFQQLLLVLAEVLRPVLQSQNVIHDVTFLNNRL